MSAGDPEPNDDSSHSHRFATTHWSVVVAAGLSSDPAARQALATLCEDYWYPLYAYIRRRGCQPAEAQDLAQGYFLQLLQRNVVQAADQTRGRFRSFLLSSLDHYMANQWRHDQAQKRGGGQIRSLDVEEGERRYRLEPVDEMTPEKIYERQWAMTLLNKAVETLRDEYLHAGKLHVFEALKTYLGGEESTVPYRELAAQLGSSEGAVKVAVHRLRQRCRDCLRRTIAQTVASDEEVDEELRHLFEVVQG
ncbi:MAG: RNA polymerase sigma factor [Pirellulaceae bacterium]